MVTRKTDKKHEKKFEKNKKTGLIRKK